jgi:hypothetical protein
MDREIPEKQCNRNDAGNGYQARKRQTATQPQGQETAAELTQSEPHQGQHISQASVSAPRAVRR